MSLPVKSVVVPFSVLCVRASVMSPCSSLGTNPSTTRDGIPKDLAMRAIADAYCSLSPTIAVPPSSWVIR